MKLEKAFLLLNGDAPKELPNLKEYKMVCATDGAYQFLKENNVTPNFISGDFDSLESLPEDISEEIAIIETPDQDFTDFDKALQILFKKGFTKVDVYGASGGEQDHFLGNLHTALIWKDKIQITFYDNYGVYYLAKKETRIDNCLRKTISLIPFFEVKNITTTGLEFPLKNETLQFSKRIGTRNKALEDKIEITFESGNLFIFVNH
jgi:thiamine pyrophosphokinase